MLRFFVLQGKSESKLEVQRVCGGGVRESGWWDEAYRRCYGFKKKKTRAQAVTIQTVLSTPVYHFKIDQYILTTKFASPPSSELTLGFSWHLSKIDLPGNHPCFFQWFSIGTSQREALRFEPPGRPGPFCSEFTCFPCASTGLPPSTPASSSSLKTCTRGLLVFLHWPLVWLCVDQVLGKKCWMGLITCSFKRVLSGRSEKHSTDDDPFHNPHGVWDNRCFLMDLSH